VHQKAGIGLLPVSALLDLANGHGITQAAR